MDDVSDQVSFNSCDEEHLIERMNWIGASSTLVRFFLKICKKSFFFRMSITTRWTGNVSARPDTIFRWRWKSVTKKQVRSRILFAWQSTEYVSSDLRHCSPMGLRLSVVLDHSFQSLPSETLSSHVHYVTTCVDARWQIVKKDFTIWE